MSQEIDDVINQVKAMTDDEWLQVVQAAQEVNDLIDRLQISHVPKSTDEPPPE